MDLSALIAAHADGGVVSRARLLALGADPREVSALRHAGALTVIRRGWYAIVGADPAVVAAVRSGGTLTCVSALRFAQGVWVPPGITRAHVRWPAHLATAASARRLRTRATGTPRCGTPSTPGSTDRSTRCHAHRGLPTSIRAIDPLTVALQCAAHCLSDDYLVAVLDSTLRMPHPAPEPPCPGAESS
ncbi:MULTISPECIES: type IV toxin-antitoxin system AbiEi family antitoxin domain-containing protein [Tsukamurella]|uniref:Type IV toxin-antitoxin system AbiEi family antitoxin domain-containing protein n=1 Tax=Tsukamurella columbiensis TaxID=128509 RepID=A0ABX1LJ87_9ACTN|nr:MULTISPECIES: type IV toxin-antitoxin system AbiEi family antitoxin domain-containing protein [Tsukamurella]NMD58364.1 type IV toxin-antitoxin system AbiEi family antitoxin domain-containing protein [Tsukamurella columbiensis]